MKRMLVTASFLVAACAAEKAAAPPVVPDEPKPVVLATFEGEVDRVAGTVTIRSTPTLGGQALGANFTIVPEGTPGVSVTQPGPATNDGPGKCTDGSGANSTWATIRITSNYASPLQLLYTYAEITSLSNMAAASCNSTAAIPGVSPNNGGLWSYGTIGPGGFAEADWAFTFRNGTSTTFRGRIVAFLKKTKLAGAPTIPTIGYTQRAMAGTTSRAVFLDQAAGKVLLMDADLAITESAVLAGIPRAVATNAAGDQIWVTIPPPTNKLVRLNASGETVQEVIPSPATLALAAPSKVVVDSHGVVWFTLVGTSGVGWYDPSTSTQGQLALPGPAQAYTLLALDWGSSCFIYVGLATGDLARISCDTKTNISGNVALTGVAGCSRQNMQIQLPLVKDSLGNAWSIGATTASDPRTLCKILPSIAGVAPTVSAVLTGTSNDFFGLAWVPGSGPTDSGSLWTIGTVSSGLRRIWLGSDYLYSATDVDGWTTGNGIVYGAGAVWAPGMPSGTETWMEWVIP